MKIYDKFIPSHQHNKSGDFYELLEVTNLHATKKGYKIMAVYRGKDSKVWSVSFKKFEKKMKKLPVKSTEWFRTNGNRR